MAYTDILYEKKNGVAWITINRPEVRNAFRTATVAELTDAFLDARWDPAVGVVVLRVREPGLPRAFRTPAVFVVGPLGALSALYLMISLPLRTWMRLLIWFVIGMVLYFAYGMRHSRLAIATTE